MNFVAQSTLSDLNFKKFLIVFILPFVSVLMFYQMSFGLNMAVFGLVVNLLILSDTEVSAKEKLAYLVIAIALCFNFFWYADHHTLRFGADVQGFFQGFVAESGAYFGFLLAHEVGGKIIF